ncbi:hypothetical protein HMPREF3232_00643 [Fannyhessea vaginae]|nr:hypothetical protein HMPREF3232_00643 [Fannyhessea vaginae]
MCCVFIERCTITGTDGNWTYGFFFEFFLENFTKSYLAVYL